MLFQIENQYCYGLKIPEQLVHQLKEIHHEELTYFFKKWLVQAMIITITFLFSQ